MRGGGRIVGLAIMAISAVLFLGWTATVVTAGTTAGGTVLGLFLALVVCAPLLGIGFYLWRKGQQEETEFAQVAQEKKILNMVLTQGQVSVQEIIVELQQPRETVAAEFALVQAVDLVAGTWRPEVAESVFRRWGVAGADPAVSEIHRSSHTCTQRCARAPTGRGTT